jgi:hypothetical protein
VLAVFSSREAPTIFDSDPDKVVTIGGKTGDRLDTQRTVSTT